MPNEKHRYYVVFTFAESYRDTPHGKIVSLTQPIESEEGIEEAKRVIAETTVSGGPHRKALTPESVTLLNWKRIE